MTTTPRHIYTWQRSVRPVSFTCRAQAQPTIPVMIAKTNATDDEGKSGQAYALDSVAVSRPRVLSRREFVIELGDLVQPIDDLFVGHCGRVATTPFRFLAEERGIGRNRGYSETARLGIRSSDDPS
jgi:hypothetical protein